MLFSILSPRPGLPRKTIQYRKWRDVDADQYAADARAALADLPSDDVNSAVAAYNQRVSEITEKHAPFKTSTFTIRPDSPWFTKEIGDERRLRRRLERQAARTKLAIHQEMHSAQKNKVNFLIEEAKTKYYRSNIVDAPSSRDRWKFCNKILRKSESTPLPEEPSSEIALANTFNTFFLDKIKTIRDGLASAPLPYPPHLASARPTFSGVPLSEFDKVSEADVEKVLKESPNASCSLDPTPTWMLKKCIAVFLPILTLLINLSLASGEFCAEFKKAHVIPLLKKFDLDRNILKNYRPVSNLPFLSKLIERIVCRQLIAHLIRNNLYEFYQSAYRALHSTETALLRVLSDQTWKICRPAPNRTLLPPPGLPNFCSPPLIACSV